jgi:putative glycosyltransferase (TIGR04372 family)
MKIFATLSARALGDFAAYALLAGSIAEMFDDSELFVFYRADRPYKDAIASYIRGAKLLRIPRDIPASVPIEAFDVHHGRLDIADAPWGNVKINDADIVITGNMMREAMLNSIPITTLGPPDEAVVQGDEALMNLGLDPSKWVAAVYWKEPNYAFRGEHALRTIYDPAPYIEAIRHITENLGGQVVRLGHPTNVQIPAFKGFIDLAKIENSEALQLYAVSVSRFFVGSGSGPISYGSALGVPTAVMDQNILLAAWRPHDYIVTQDIFYNGQWLNGQAAWDAGMLVPGWKPQGPIEYRRNTAAQLVAACDEMFKSTVNCIGWRNTVEPEPRKSPRPNAISFPIPHTYRPELLIPPSNRMKGTDRRMYKNWVIVP